MLQMYKSLDMPRHPERLLYNSNCYEVAAHLICVDMWLVGFWWIALPSFFKRLNFLKHDLLVIQETSRVMTEKTSITQFLTQLNRSTYSLVINRRFSQLSVNKKVYFVFPVVTMGFVWLYLQDDALFSKKSNIWVPSCNIRICGA